jgi:hypothetical protein
MTANLNDAIQTIKKVGVNKTRIVPMEGQSPLEGQQEIQVLRDGKWESVVTGLSRKMAEEFVAQAANKVILG